MAHAIATTTHFSYTLGNYADKWSSKSEYDPETGWKLTEGNMEGGGSIVTSIVTSIVDVTDSVHDIFGFYDYRDDVNNYYYQSFSVGTDTKHRSTKANRTETISLKQAVENGAWVTTEQTRTINETAEAEENNRRWDFAYNPNDTGCHETVIVTTGGRIEYVNNNKTVTKRIDGLDVTTRDVYQSTESTYHSGFFRDDTHYEGLRVYIFERTESDLRNNRTTINDNGTLTDEGSFESRYWREYYGGNQEGKWVEGTLSGHRGRTLFYGEVEEYEYEGYPYSHDYFRTITPPQTSGSPTSFEIRDRKSVAPGPAVEAEKVNVPLPYVPAQPSGPIGSETQVTDEEIPQYAIDFLRETGEGYIDDLKMEMKSCISDCHSQVEAKPVWKGYYFSGNWTYDEMQKFQDAIRLIQQQIPSLITEAESIKSRLTPEHWGIVKDDMEAYIGVLKGVQAFANGDVALSIRQGTILPNPDGAVDGKYYYFWKQIYLNTHESADWRKQSIERAAKTIFHEASHRFGTHDGEPGESSLLNAHAIASRLFEREDLAKSPIFTSLFPIDNRPSYVFIKK